ERDSESHWLRLAPKARSASERLARVKREIMAHAATWTTAEHRRAASRTIYYHAEELPSDLAARVRPFEEFVGGILSEMPPPVSHIRHFQWLPAVRIYREAMEAGGRGADVDLLHDPRNQP